MDFALWTCQKPTLKAWCGLCIRDGNSPMTVIWRDKSHTHAECVCPESGHRDARCLQCTMNSYGIVIGLPLWSQTVASLRQPVFFSFVLKQRQHEPRVHPRIRVPHTELIFYICLEVEDYAVSVLAPDTPSPSLYAAREGPEGIMVFSVSGHNR